MDSQIPHALASILPTYVCVQDDNETEQIELSDLVVNYFEHIGVDYVFGVPGGAIEPLYDALARSERRGGPRAVVARHESGAAFMADGYARETGKIGVCCATTGPGTTNLITGVASAYADQVPMLVITAQTTLSNFGRGAFQESSPDAISTVGMFEHCTRYNTMVTHPEQLEIKLIAAITIAMRSPKGPAHISVPLDIFRSLTTDQRAYSNLEQSLCEPSLVDFGGVEMLCQELHQVLSNQRKVVLLIGGGCHDAIKEVIKFAELICAPIVTTPTGKSCIDPFHPLACGVFGFAGHESARKALVDESVDLILAIGTTLGEWATNGWDTGVMNNKLVHIHSSSNSFARSPMARLHLCGHIGTVFELLFARVDTMKRSGMPCPSYSSEELSAPTLPFPDRRLVEKYRCAPRHIEIQNPENYRRERNVSPPIKPQRLMCELKLRFPPQTRFLADTGNSFSWTTHYLFNTGGGVYRLAMGFASMGWAIGAAVGTALGNPEFPVVCITGDGSFLMSGQEITVAIAEQLPVVFVILNDQALGMVKHGQRLTGAEPVGYEIPPVDFCQMAKAMGANAYTIKHPNDFDKIDFEAICSCIRPTLLDIHVDPEEVPPIGMRAKALE
ncbi:MAG: thiamine pyrophosphate-binding protein [Candidatus Parabeggiatoa sp. nov. 1]|nr:MAG: thiamine pyrophosphate-binding protein [Gammaproteobacteria bacterium]